MSDVKKRWEETSRKYRNYIKLEKRLSDNTVESYMRDAGQLAEFVAGQYNVTPKWVTAPMILPRAENDSSNRADYRLLQALWPCKSLRQGSQ